MSAPQAVIALVDRFHQQLAAYKQNNYNEEQLRVEFLNPLFKLLGWDVDNEQGYAAAYKEVVHDTRRGRTLAPAGHGLRFGRFLDYALPAPVRLVPDAVCGRERGEMGARPGAAALSHAVGRLAADAGGTQAHPAGARARGGHRRPGGGGDQAVAAAQVVGGIDFTDPTDIARHTRMVALVERMLALHERRAAARTPQEQVVLQAQIDATDRKIDRLVYALYGLKEEEVRVVEGS